MSSDDYSKRLTAALAELDAKGVRQSASRPPYFRLARHYNLQVRPPYYASPAFNAVFACMVFSVFWALAMWLFVWSKADITLKALFVQSVNGGIIAGLATALFCYLAFRFHKLTPWDQLLETETTDPP